MAARINFTEEQINFIIQAYTEQQKSMKDIGALFGVGKGVISRILKEHNIQARSHPHLYKANYQIFKNIDTAEKAYWLGFIAADGCNYQREHNSSVIINIHRQDKEHLEKFRYFMESDVKIIDHIQTKGFSNNTPMSKLVLNSKEMSQDLADKGIVPNKSLILQPPKIAPEFYLPYILGYFDGDGGLYKTNQYNNFSWSLQGTEETLSWVKEVLNIEAKLEKRNANSISNSYYIRLGGTKKIYDIMCILYNSSPVNLTRKYEIYKNLETVVLGRNTK